MKVLVFFSLCLLFFSPVSSLGSDNDSDISVKTRIIGGKAAQARDFPYQAVIMSSNNNGYGGATCGGTIIASNWVLTAAHCIKGDDSASKQPKDINIGVGITDLRQTKPENLVPVSRIVVHPQFSKSNQGMLNDIALIQTSSPIVKKVGGVQTSTASLPENEQQFNAGTKATASGFGDTDRWGGTSSPVLKSVEVSVLPGDKCPSKWFKQEMHICAGNLEGGNDICQGDSGGPLVVNNGGKSVVIGLPSFMSRADPVCGAANEPTGYAKVSHFTNWITQTMGAQG